MMQAVADKLNATGRFNASVQVAGALSGDTDALVTQAKLGVSLVVPSDPGRLASQFKIPDMNILMAPYILTDPVMLKKLPDTALFKEWQAELEKQGKLGGIITQNIDGLHQKAGSVNVQEIHGTTLVNHCVVCRKQFGADFIFGSPDPIPKCPVCGNMVRPDVTLYGETLPSPAYDNAWKLVNEADCLIIGGTSLEVGSAAQLAHIFRGKHLIIINKGKTKLTGRADLVFRDSIGKVLSGIS
mgnify:CR=1 FL=1